MACKHEHHKHKGKQCTCGCHCGCQGQYHAGPTFWTRAEKIAWLEERLEELQAEAKAVQERINELNQEA